MDVLELIDQGKIKGVFRTREKFSYPEACCHITQRAPGKEKLFLEKEDYLFILHLVKEKSQKFSFEVYSFSLMPNHIHLQIKLKKSNLSVAMKSLFGDYAQSFNKKYERKGHVFCGAYGQALCLDDSYALATSIYIHLNAVRAGLVNYPWEYRWSSCGLYMESKKSFVNEKFILGILDEDISKAREIYKKLLIEALSIKTDELWERVGALDLFKLRLFDKIKGSVVLEEKFLPKQEDILLEDKVLDEKIEELRRKNRLKSPHALEARRYLIDQLKARGYTISQIAERFNVSRQSIYDATKR